MIQSNTSAAIYLDEHFIVEASNSCFVPGYVIVSPRVPAGSLSAMNADALASLGQTLAAVTKAVAEVVGAERVYCGLFCEQFRSVHFHVFPRTAQLLAEHNRAHPGETALSGPLIMDWASRTFSQPIPDVNRDEIHRKIRDCLCRRPN